MATPGQQTLPCRGISAASISRAANPVGVAVLNNPIDLFGADCDTNSGALSEMTPSLSADDGQSKRTLPP